MCNLENNNQQSQISTKPQPDKTIKVVHFGIVWSFFIKRNLYLNSKQKCIISKNYKDCLNFMLISNGLTLNWIYVCQHILAYKAKFKNFYIPVVLILIYLFLHNIRNILHKYSLRWFGILYNIICRWYNFRVLFYFSCQLYQIYAILYDVVKIYFIYYIILLLKMFNIIVIIIVIQFI